MAKLLQLRGGTTSQHSSFTGAVREVTVDTDKDVLVVHDGSTAGGFPAHRDLKGSDIASADPLVIVAGSNYYIVTGTTGFNDMTVAANHHFFLEFAGILTMTHVGGALDLPSAAPITTAAGDVGEFFATAANVVTCVSYTKASGKPVKTDFVNADINASAAIAQSKLVDIVNADVDASAAIALSKLASNPSSIGLSTIWVPAVAMYPTSSNGCESVAQVEVTAQRPELKTLDFKTAADAYAQFAIAFPKSWDRSYLQYQTYWSVTGTNTNTVVFELAAVAISSDDPMNPVFGTAVANTGLAASGTADDLMVNVKSGNITVGGTPAEGDQVFFQLMRDVSAGTQTADVRLLGVKLFFTTNAENDA